MFLRRHSVEKWLFTVTVEAMPYVKCDASGLIPLAPYVTSHNEVNPSSPSERDVIYWQPLLESLHDV